MNYRKAYEKLSITVDKNGVFTTTIDGRKYVNKRDAVDSMMRMMESKHDQWNNEYYCAKHAKAKSITKKPRPKPNIQKIDNFIDWREAA